MENARSNSKMKIKVKASNENIDAGCSPLTRYFFAGSPTTGKVTSSGEVFTSRCRFSLSPLSSVENLDIAPPPVMYRTPVKVDEEVLVMDDIQVRPTAGAKSGRSSSSSSSGRGPSSSTSSWSPPPPFVRNVLKTESGNCRYNSKCQVVYGREELHPTRLSMMSKSEAQPSRSPTSVGSSIHGRNSRTVNQHSALAESKDAVVITSQPASPVKPKPHHTLANPNAFNDWSPLDDGIEVVLPNGLDEAPTREEVEAYILSTLHGPTIRRLPVFEKICWGQ